MLSELKVYLRIDEDLPELDSEISRMLNAAISYFEKKTNIHLKQKEKPYFPYDGYVDVFDYPIFTTNMDDVTILEYQCYSRIFTKEKITLTIGYNTCDIPADIKECIFSLVRFWFYENEKQIDNSLIPNSVLDVVNVNRRYI